MAILYLACIAMVVYGPWIAAFVLVRRQTRQ